jgi:hypothetical protein
MGRTALAALPLVPLGLVYLGLTRRGGPMRPEWGQLANPFSPRAWAAQLVWADPVSIASKGVLPFGIGDGVVPKGVAGLLAPAFLVLAAAILAVGAGIRTRGQDAGSGRGGAPAAERRAWVALAALLILGGMASPDTLGASHGQYLPPRILLLGLAALVPGLDLDPRRTMVRACAAALVAALAIQSAFLWDYGLRADRVAGTFWRARGDVGRGRRIATLLLDLRGRFRANPMFHADCLLGLGNGNGNVLWSNYETRYYYFPVQFRPGIDRPDSADLELLSIRDDPADADARARDWERLLRRHHASIDLLAVWGSDPRLDAISGRWFRPEFREGPLRFLRHR